MRVSKRAAARLFLSRQHLDRTEALTPASLDRLACDLGGIQLDSINVVERAHYLTLWSRFGVYDRAALDELVYKQRALFDYWAHAASLIAASDLPYWRRAMKDYKLRHTGWSDWLKNNPRVVKRVEDAIRARGPMASKDFAAPAGKKKSAGWWDWKPEAHALQYLWMSGRIAVDTRAHFHKTYDLSERVLPPGEPAVDWEGFKRWHLKKSLRAMGAASEADLVMYLTFPHFGTGQRRKTLGTMIKAGEVVELALDEDDERWFALKENIPALEKAEDLPPPEGTTLLAPFDSFLWHRERVRKLFGFDYKIEVYTPGPKRKYGYYSLPILHAGRLIGRLDPKNHRAEKRLEIRAVHFEESFVRGKDVEAGLAGTAGAIKSLAEFLGSREIAIGRVFPARLRLPVP